MPNTSDEHVRFRTTKNVVISQTLTKQQKPQQRKYTICAKHILPNLRNEAFFLCSHINWFCLYVVERLDKMICICKTCFINVTLCLHCVDISAIQTRN